MISNFVLQTLKLEVAPRKVIYVNYKGMEFAFKSLSKKEYDEVVSLSFGDSDELSVLVCEFTYLYPKDYNFRTSIAGLCQYVSKIIIDQSLVVSVDGIKEELEKQRVNIKKLETQCFIAIKSAMPEITREMFDNMSWQEILENVAISEQILTIRHSSLIAANNNSEFDFSLQFQETEEVTISDEEKIAMKKKETEELLENGIDPAILHKYSLVNRVDNITPTILTGGRYWNRSDVLDVIRRESNRGDK